MQEDGGIDEPTCSHNVIGVLIAAESLPMTNIIPQEF